MKRLLILSVAFCAMATAVSAQPAFDGSQGPPPQDYPVCTQRGQDRCIQRSEARRIERERRQADRQAGAPSGGQSSTDGERG